MAKAKGLRRGDGVLVPFPFADMTSRKVRPSLVVSWETYHSTEPDIIVAAMTSMWLPIRDRQTTPFKIGRKQGCMFLQLLKAF